MTELAVQLCMKADINGVSEGCGCRTQLLAATESVVPAAQEDYIDPH
jgi:hypothetical protein